MGKWLPVQEALRGGIPQSASMTSFAAVYGALSDDEAAGLTPLRAWVRAMQMAWHKAPLHSQMAEHGRSTVLSQKSSSMDQLKDGRLDRRLFSCFMPLEQRFFKNPQQNSHHGGPSICGNAASR